MEGRSIHNRGDPPEQARIDLATVDLVEHFVSATRIEIVGDVPEAGYSIALHEKPNPLQLLTHGTSLPEKR